MKQRVFQIVGYKNSGKTTLICELLPLLGQRGFRVGTIKHDAHSFTMDTPGTDTWKHREAGADMVAITSQESTAVFEQRHTPLNQLINRMRVMDIVLVEGFKDEGYPKIVLLRGEEDEELLDRLDGVLAVVSPVRLGKRDLEIAVYNRKNAAKKIMQLMMDISV